MTDHISNKRLTNAIVLFLCMGIIGLLMPVFMERWRFPTRIAHCKNHLRQLGIAATAYSTMKDRLPSYVVDYGFFKDNFSPTHTPEIQNPIPVHRKVGTWVVALLPTLDQQAVYEGWSTYRFPTLTNLKSDASEHGNANELSGLRFNENLVPNLSCLMCPNSTVDPSTSNLSFAINTGLCVAENAPDHADSIRTSSSVVTNRFPGLLPDGVPVAIGAERSFKDIADGTSTTILFAENLQVEPWHRVGFTHPEDFLANDTSQMMDFPIGARFTQGVGWHDELGEGDFGGASRVPARRINGTFGNQPLNEKRMTPSNAADLARPSSMHPGTVNVAFADGAIKTLSETIDYQIYASLMCPNDSECGIVPSP